MSTKRRPSIRLLAVGDVLQAREDPEVRCRVIELGTGIDGGGDVVEVFAASTPTGRLGTARIKRLLRINKAALRWNFERIGRLSEQERALSQFDPKHLRAFLLTESVLRAARGTSRKPSRKKRSTNK